MREHSDIDRHSRWLDVKKKLDSDQRYRVVDSSLLRENYFHDYCKLLKEEKKKIKEKDRDRKEKKEKEKRERDKDKHRDRGDNKDREKDRSKDKRRESKDSEKDKDEKKKDDDQVYYQFICSFEEVFLICCFFT